MLVRISIWLWAMNVSICLSEAFYKFRIRVLEGNLTYV